MPSASPSSRADYRVIGFAVPRSTRCGHRGGLDSARLAPALQSSRADGLHVDLSCAWRGYLPGAGTAFRRSPASLLLTSSASTPAPFARASIKPRPQRAEFRLRRRDRPLSDERGGQGVDALVFLPSVVAFFVRPRLGTANLPGQIPQRPPASCCLCWLRPMSLLRRLNKCGSKRIPGVRDRYGRVRVIYIIGRLLSLIRHATHTSPPIPSPDWSAGVVIETLPCAPPFW